MKKTIILSIILTVLFSVNVNAQSTIKLIKERGVLRVGTTERQLPFSFRDGNGKLIGVDIDLSKRLAKEMNVEVKFVKIDLANIVDSLKSGSVDVIFSGLSITTSRNMEILFTQPYFETGKGIFSKNGKLKSGKTKHINQSYVKLTAVKNSSSIEYIKKHYASVEIIVGETGDKCVDLLNSGEADAMITDYETCEYLYYYGEIKGNYNYALLNNEEGDDHEYIGAAVSDADFLFYNLVNNFLIKMDRNNEFSIIKQDWLKYSK